MKKGHSASWLQEAFVRLHQILFQRKLLPLSGFGEYRAHKPRERGAFDKNSISRRAFVLFIRRESERVRRNAICPRGAINGDHGLSYSRLACLGLRVAECCTQI